MIDMVPINLKAVKIEIEDNWHQTWRYMANDKPKLQTYMKWKECPVPELYMTNKLPKYHCSLITKLALGVLPIRIETGRYEKLLLKDRICQSCKWNTIETEEHFLFHCPLYESQRVQIMPNASDRNWVEIRCKPFSFGRLIHRMWEIRWGLLMKERETKEEKYRENWLARQSHAIQAEAAKIGVETLKRWARQKEGKCTGAILQLKLNNICEKSKQAGCFVAFRTNTSSETSLDAMVLKEGEIEVNKSNISLIKPSTSMLCNKMVLKEANIGNVENVSLIEPSTSMLCNKMVLKEANNSNIDNITLIEPTTSMLCNKMVLKEANISNVENVSLIEPSTSMLCNKMVSKEANDSNIGNISVIKPTTSMSCNNMVLKEATKQASKGKKLCKYCTKVCNHVNTDGKMYICSGKGIKGPGPPSTEGGSDK